MIIITPNNLRRVLSKWREFVFLGVAILLGVGTTVSFLIPSIQSVLVARRNEQSRRIYLSQVTNKYSQLEQLNESSVRANLEKAQIILPATKDIPGVYDTVVRLEDISGIIVDLLQTTPGNISKVKSDQPEALSVSFASRGTLAGAQSFLANVLNVPRIIHITSFRFSQSENQGSFAIQANTYFLGLPNSLPPITEPLPVLTGEEEASLR